MNEQREHDLRAELDAHLELETLEGIERGLAPDAARTAAHRVLGSVPAIQDHVRDVWRSAVLAQAWQDARYAVRTLRRSPLWTAAALIALALGIGANTAIFSLADALLFRPLAIAGPDRVLTISTASAESAAEGVSYPDFDDLRHRVDAVDGAVGYRLALVGVATSPDSLPQMRMSMAVTGEFFQALGVAPALGRAFLRDESETPGRDAVAILSHDLAQRLQRGSTDRGPHRPRRPETGDCCRRGARVVHRHAPGDASGALRAAHALACRRA